jgi:hypothetical protein
MNTHTIIEELLDALFSMQSMLYQTKAGYLFFPELLVYNSISSITEHDFTKLVHFIIMFLL